jgi:myo-inositol-1(or 4)-monophosphatase
LNSGERIPRQLCCGVSEQNTKKVLDGTGFLVSFAARSFNTNKKISTFKRMKKTLIKSIYSAGQILMSYFGKLSDYQVKENQSSIVTAADVESELGVIETIGERFPGHNTLGEESGFQHRGSDYTWVVDPLDGTSNFAAGLPWFGVIICVLKHSEPLMAGCYIPFFNELYFAEKGKGATLNGRPVVVSQESSLKNVLFSYGIDYSEDPGKTDREVKIIGELVQRIRNLRTTNCLMDFCYIADGRIGGCINQSTRIWDIAGPALIVEEAGGVFTDIQGEPVQYAMNASDYGKNYPVVGTTKKLHASIIQLIKNTER